MIQAKTAEPLRCERLEEVGSEYFHKMEALGIRTVAKTVFALVAINSGHDIG